MKVSRNVWNFLDSNMYVFEERNHVLIIDPVDNGAVLKRCSGATSATVLLTHEHFDHICGFNPLRELCCTVIAGKQCSERIKGEKTNLSAYADVLAELSDKPVPNHWSPFACKEADITFENRLAFRWMGHAVELYYTPGHSAGSCCILLDDMLFVGDTVLDSGLMVKFPGSSKMLYRSVTVPLLEMLLIGDRVTCVYPGHGDAMTPEMALELVRGV